MNDNLVIAQQCFLDNRDLQKQQLESLLGIVAKRDVDAADIYFQSSRYESWVLEDGIIKEGGFSRDMGAGIRAVSGEKTGFAYTDQIHWNALEQAAKSAREIAGTGHGSHSPIKISTSAVQRYTTVDPIKSLPEAEKINLLKQAESIAFTQNSNVKRVTVSLTGAEDIVMVADLEGKMSADVRPLIRLNLSVIVEKDGRIEQGHFGGGGRYDYRYFIENNKAESYAKEAVRQALVNLEAVDAPAGNMPVVLGPGWPGVLLHEAVGHGLEGDFNRKGSSFYSGKIGEKVASPGVTIVDDGTLADRRGSLSMDDEGTDTQSTTLIEDGVLKGYLFDKMNARLMNTQSTGNGRRESYAHLPMPRMTNTYMLAGDKTPEEILASIDKGIYAVNFSGGQVDITSGKFVFSASEAYMVEKGKIMYPIKGATLIGSGHEVMQKVSMIGNDLELDAGVGVCGKEGQSVPVGVGQPTLKIDEIIVGGTEV